MEHLVKIAQTIKSLEDKCLYKEADVLTSIFREAAKNHGGLQDWFRNEKWVDLRRPKRVGVIKHVEEATLPKAKNQFAHQQTKLKT